MECKFYPCYHCNSFWGVSPDYCTFCQDYVAKTPTENNKDNDTEYDKNVTNNNP